MHVLALLSTILLPTADFAVCNYANHQIYPHALHENNQYYVFWTDYRSAPIYSVYGARVAEDGTVIDVNGKLQFADSVFNPRAAYDGTNFLIVWREGC